MIVWTGNPHTIETAPAWEGAELRAWRWTLEIEWSSISLQEQVRFGDAPWRPSHSLGYYMAGISTKPDAWHFGMHHDYYDGPHHALWLGPLWLNWSPREWCTVCMPPDEEDTSGVVEGFVESILNAAMECSRVVCWKDQGPCPYVCEGQTTGRCQTVFMGAR